MLPFYKEASKTNKMEKFLTPEEKKQIDKLLKKHRPQPREEEMEQQKEMTVTSEKGTKIVVKSEIVGTSLKPFKDRPIEKTEEASKREYKLVGTNMETEYEGIDMAEEERQVVKLNKEDDTEMLQQGNEVLQKQFLGNNQT